VLAAAAKNAATEVPPPPSYAELSIKQLKEELRARGISMAGMMERSELVAALASAAPQPPSAIGGARVLGAAAAAPPPLRKVYTGLADRAENTRCALGTCRGVLDVKDTFLCSGCRSVAYCSQGCLELHWGAHKEDCYNSISDRMDTGDVHHEDAGGEYVLVDAVQEHTRAHGPLDERTLMCTLTLGRFYRRLGKLSKAEPLLRSCLARFRAALGLRHEYTLIGVSELAQLLYAQGKLDEAEPLCREALKGQRETLGHKHQSTIASMGNLAGIMADQGKLGEAEPLFREGLAAARETRGPRHFETLLSMSNLVRLLANRASWLRQN